ncbi:glycine receptor subunit alpha-1-like isoform X2 [Mizuhopecten yessoensis]|uniref:glycine receptor subunit alpha-1-like isoform X2 n=1 Tax=Mizuhopecten yessoensis TaxID=6573 RepID=UPI000B45BD84|nr:glycine receptor subunit alpha-1-like isoform X2 [Mizuhopecten yessoensis]
MYDYRALTQCWETLNERISQETYDFYNPPWTVTGDSIEVGLKVGISQLKSAGVSDLSLTIHVLQTWNDPRVCFNASSLPSGQTTAPLAYRHQGLVWSPDVYPEGAVTSTQHDVILPNVFLRIQPNGTILKSNRLTVQIQCPTSDTKFPKGNQRCIVRFKSYSFTTDEVCLSWLKEGFTKLDDFSSNVVVDEIAIDTCKHTLFLDEQPCIELSLSLERNFDVYLTRIYLPSAIVVFLSWISLWIDVRQVPARTGLSVVCVLSLMTQTVGLMVVSDDDGSILAVDAWMIVCLLYTVWALVTFITAHYLDSTCQRRAQKTAIMNVEEEMNNSKGKSCTIVGYKRLERVVKFVYPVSFVVFNVVYWAYFMSG